MSAIDFTEWTDAQLDAAERFADRSEHGGDLLAEIERRKAAGTWKTDGSHERVEALIASARKPGSPDLEARQGRARRTRRSAR